MIIWTSNEWLCVGYMEGIGRDIFQHTILALIWKDLEKKHKKNQPGTLLSPLSRVLVSIRITVLWKVRPYSNVEFCQPLSYIYPEKQYLCST